MVDYKVLITTSGLGSRLGNLTKCTNKSLVRVGDKPAISHIIECYPSATEFVVTLGHYGTHIKQFLTLAYPNVKFTFVDVDNYSGEGSSLLYSISQCKQHLQSKFIFHACDTILPQNYMSNVVFSENWVIGGEGLNSQVYRTVNVAGNKLININDKGEQHFDLIYVGVAGIQDYQSFWNICDQTLNETRSSDLSDCHVIQQLNDVNVIRCSTWFDIGNIDALRQARTVFKSTMHVLDKQDENIYIVDGVVIKFFANSQICSDRVERAKSLSGLVPEVLGHTDNFYKYDYVTGDLLADNITLPQFKKLLDWASKNLWVPVQDGSTAMYDDAQYIYKHKTLERVQQFLDKYNMKDQRETINDVVVPPVFDLISEIDFSDIIGTNATKFHGDFILDNILCIADNFVLIDWRQNFGKSIIAGDMMYDLAKLNHNLYLNHKVLLDGGYTLDVGSNIKCDVVMKKMLSDCHSVLQKFCAKHQISYKNVQILTALIWLSMAPLHEYPLDKFLYYFGKYNLGRLCDE